MSGWRYIVVDGCKNVDYLISMTGKVINGSGHKLKHRKNNRGYHIIDLYLSPKQKKTLLVHRLVAEAFIPNPENHPSVNHIDGNKDNNKVSNLEWCSYSANNKHAYDTGLRHGQRGSDSPFAIYDESLVRKVCQRLTMPGSPKDIARELDVPLHLVRSIKSGESWRCVSSEYPIQKPRFYMHESMKDSILSAYQNGKSITDILKLLGWPNKSKYIKRVRRVLNKE